MDDLSVFTNEQQHVGCRTMRVFVLVLIGRQLPIATRNHQGSRVPPANVTMHAGFACGSSRVHEYEALF